MDNAQQIKPKRRLFRPGRSSRADEMGLAGYLLRLLVLVVFGLFFFLPLFWLLFAPSKTDNQLLNMNPLAFGSLERYIVAWINMLEFNDGQIVTWAFNSIYYVVMSLLLSVAVAVPAGYALAIMRFAGRTLILWLTMITMIIPGSALVLPLFLEMNLVRLINTPWSVILPSSFFPFGVYLSFIFFKTSLHRDVLAAARVDGCSEWQLFRHSGLPLARTLLGLLAFLSFTANWNNYFLPYVMLNKSKLYNLPVGLQALISGTTAIRPTFATDLPFHRAEAALTGLVMVLPVAIVFLLTQRYVVSGAFTGSIKQ